MHRHLFVVCNVNRSNDSVTLVGGLDPLSDRNRHSVITP